MKDAFRRLSAAREKFESTGFFRNWLLYILVPVMAGLQWLIVQLCCQSFADCMRVEPKYMLLETALLFFITAVLALCTGRWWALRPACRSCRFCTM